MTEPTSKATIGDVIDLFSRLSSPAGATGGVIKDRYHLYTTINERLREGEVTLPHGVFERLLDRRRDEDVDIDAWAMSLARDIVDDD